MRIKNTCRLGMVLALLSASSASMAAGLLLADTGPAYTYQPVGTTPLYAADFNDGPGITDSTFLGSNVNGKWYDIAYGGATQSAAPARAVPPWTSVGTDKALKFSPQALPHRTGIQYILPLPLQLNTRYRISMRIGTCPSSCAAAVRVTLLGKTTNFDVIPVSQTVQLTPGTALGTSYKDVVINGVFAITDGAPVATPRGLRIFPLTANTPIYIDSIKVEAINANPLNFAEDIGFGVASVNTPLTMDPKMFGLHVNELGTHNTWPALGQQVVRLWGTPTMWFDLESSQNLWAWNQGYDGLTYHVDYVRNNNLNADIIYTLGQTPTWASTNPTLTTACSYGYRQAGSCASPVSANDWADWKDYIYQVASRNLGKIKYYEIWNEPGAGNFFTTPAGVNDPNSPAVLATMTCKAKEALQAADPNNTYGLKLIGPAVGGAWLDEYLEMGGGNCLDIFNYHSYFSPVTAESTLPADVANVKFTMKAYGLTNKPIWNTESGAHCDGSTGVLCPANYVPSTGVQMGTLPRALALQWANGVTNSNYFFMEGAFESWTGLVQRKAAGSNCQATVNGCLSEMALLPLGKGFVKAGSWLKNTKLLSAYTMPQGIYIFKLQTAAGALRYLVWSTSSTATTIRAPYSWDIRSVERLDGTSTTYGYSVWVGYDITLNPLEPILLKSPPL